MPKKAKIRFEMDDLADISDQIIEINNDFYTKKTSQTRGSLRFSIPTPIKVDLGLKAGDTCFFCQYSEGFYISFKIKPDAATKSLTKSRRLASAGAYNTLYVCIPPFIKNLYKKEICGVKLFRTKGFQKHEWQLQFLFTECT